MSGVECAAREPLRRWPPGHGTGAARSREQLRAHNRLGLGRVEAGIFEK
ncbi:hypothetical protein [Streptomyces sp. NPDC001750]